MKTLWLVHFFFIKPQLMSQLADSSVRVQHSSKGRPTLRSIHQCTWPKRPTAYVLCHLLCPMVPPDKLFMDSHSEPHSALMRSAFLASVQYSSVFFPVTSFHDQKATSNSSKFCQLFFFFLRNNPTLTRVFKSELVISFLFWVNFSSATLDILRF